MLRTSFLKYPASYQSAYRHFQTAVTHPGTCKYYSRAIPHVPRELPRSHQLFLANHKTMLYFGPLPYLLNIHLAPSMRGLPLQYHAGCEVPQIQYGVICIFECHGILFTYIPVGTDATTVVFQTLLRLYCVYRSTRPFCFWAEDDDSYLVFVFLVTVFLCFVLFFSVSPRFRFLLSWFEFVFAAILMLLAFLVTVACVDVFGCCFLLVTS